MPYAAVLIALADPTRRAMFESMRHRAYTVGELAKRAKIRQPTASQHLRVLREAGLVIDRPEGTRRYYSASREGLTELREYLESLWDDVLAAYARDDPNPPRDRRHAKTRGGRR